MKAVEKWMKPSRDSTLLSPLPCREKLFGHGFQMLGKGRILTAVAHQVFISPAWMKDVPRV